MIYDLLYSKLTVNDVSKLGIKLSTHLIIYFHKLRLKQLLLLLFTQTMSK